MTPEEVTLLKNAGQVLVTNFSILVIMAFCYGVYVMLVSLAMYNLLVRKQHKTIATWVLCTMLTLIFIITTSFFGVTVACNFKLMTVALIENTEVDFSDRLEIASASILQMSLAQEWLGGNGASLLFIASDGIVVWRAWAIWPNHASVIILPALTLLATFAIFLALSIMQTISFTNTYTVYGMIAILSFSGRILSVVTNFIAVVLIAVKAYQHRKFMKDIIGQGTSASGKVLMFLTESGIVYVIFQIINVCLADSTKTGSATVDWVSHIWGLILNMLSAAYPSLVVLIVNSQHSIVDITKASTSAENPGTHISFAHSSLLQGTIDSTESRAQATVLSSTERHTEKIPEAPETKDLV
ncbi:hypothetical protein C8J56DRAFT_363136 [Mycena floridula]|nr:hypothetical protein C8J56DRAFT_363136 [Mycena floridula]